MTTLRPTRDGMEDPPLGESPRRVLAGAMLFWSAFGGWLAIHTYLGTRAHGHSLGRIFVFQELVYVYWALCTPWIGRLVRRFPVVPLHASAIGVHLVVGLALAAGHLAWLLQLMNSLRPFGAMSVATFWPHYLHLLRDQLPLEVLNYAGTVGVLSAVQLAGASRARALRAAGLERQVAEARLAALDAQLQPHFLFNALNTVASLVRGREHQAAVRTLADLSELLRYSLAASRAPQVALREELAAIERYLAIQKLRFGDRLTVRFEVAPEALEAAVPRLLLQPLVENAVHHGMAATAHGGGWLELAAIRLDGRLHVVLRNGAPEQGGAAGHGVGLRNTRERLEQHFGAAGVLEVRQAADRFEVAVEIPWQPAPTPETPDE